MSKRMDQVVEELRKELPIIDVLDVTTRHFQTKLVLVDFKVKGIVVLVNTIFKLKRILFEKRSIFHLPCVDFLVAV